MFITMTAMMQGFTDKFIIETVESSGHVTTMPQRPPSWGDLLRIGTYPVGQETGPPSSSSRAA